MASNDERKRPDELLWHYTTWPALEGIFKDRQLWASRISYLNDAKEFRHAADIIQDMVQKKFKLHSGRQPTAELSSALHVSLNRITESGCVLSFSRSFDDLSQWRAYSSGGWPPIAIGFDPEAIAEHAHRQRWRLSPCVYEDNEKRNHLRPLVELADIEKLAGAEWRRECNDFGHRVLPALKIAGPFLKDPAFYLEREWRVVIAPPQVDAAHWGFHRAQSLVVPHYLADWKRADGRLVGLEGVLVGPHPHMREIMGAAGNLFEMYHAQLPNWSVWRSSIPYRNW